MFKRDIYVVDQSFKEQILTLQSTVLDVEVDNNTFRIQHLLENNVDDIVTLLRYPDVLKGNGMRYQDAYITALSKCCKYDNDSLEHALKYSSRIYVSFGVFEKSNNLVGIVCLDILRNNELNNEFNIFFGYSTNPIFQGKGITNKVVSQMLPIIKSTFHKIIYAQVFQWNNVSIHILEKNGFVRRNKEDDDDITYQY